MESVTKNRQPVGVLRAMVARAYGAGLVPAGDEWVSELGHGWFNVAYRMRLSDGREVVLKIETAYRHDDPAPYEWARGQLAEALALLG